MFVLANNRHWVIGLVNGPVVVSFSLVLIFVVEYSLSMTPKTDAMRVIGQNGSTPYRMYLASM